MEEIIAIDLIRELGMTLDQVFKTGYFKVWRLWFMLDEVRARDLQHLWNILDAAQSGDEAYRGSITDWLVQRQPRRIPPPPEIPHEKLAELERVFKRGR